MPKKQPKYIFIIGGVMSGVGKGIATSSIGKVLQSKGFIVNPVKIDPYLNVDAGTMNPTEHGETFVLRSGLETDQDMGNYERFLNKDLNDINYMTSGMVYKSVIERERNLGYKGKCVEAVPHIRNEIIDRIKKSTEQAHADVTVVEIGGTIGDYQNIMFLDAARVMHLKHPEDVMFIVVSYVPIPNKLGEMKTRPTQHALQQLNSYGVQADMVIARSSLPLDKKRKEKIALQCNVAVKHVFSSPDIESIYDAVIDCEKSKIADSILEILGMRPRKTTKLDPWKKFVQKRKRATKEANIAIVGKYFDTGDFVLSDAYISVIEAVKYSAYNEGVIPVLHWLNSKDFESGEADVKELKKYDGIIVPGGFGETGIEGKLAVIKYAREKKIPYFGLCYGMQLMTVEYARNVLRLKDANTREIDPEAKHLVVDVMEDQKELIREKNYGGTMRLGSYPAKIKKGTIAEAAYKTGQVSERHRHRYEINPNYIEQLENKGLVFSGTSPDGMLMEIVELPKSEHPFFLGTQFHPELQARPLDPHPLFTAFVKAVKKEMKS